MHPNVPRSTIVKTWKQPKCPSTEKWIKKMWYMHPRNYYSAIKENERMLFTATWRQLEIIMLSEVSQTVQFSCSVMSDSLWPHGMQHARPPCPSPTPGVYSNSCPLCRWCHSTISSSVVPFSSHLQSSQTGEEKCMIYSYMEYKFKKIQMNLFIKQKQIINTVNKFMVIKGAMLKGGINQEHRMNTCIPLYIR